LSPWVPGGGGEVLGPPVRLGLALGPPVRLGLALGPPVRLGLALGPPVRLGDGEVGGAPLHVVPLRVNVVGLGLLLDVKAPLNPIWTEALVARLRFQSRLTAEAFWPDIDQVADHPDWTDWLEVGNAKPSVQPVIGSPRLVIVTLAVNPVGHWLSTA